MNTPYDVLIRPLITEKSAYQSSKLHQYAFEVPISATRADVRDAVEKAFDVKKAIVKIRPEDRIPIFEGVE